MSTAAPFAQGFTNADSSNNLSTFERPSHGDSRLSAAHAHFAALRPCGGPEYRVPRLQQWNLSTQIPARHQDHSGHRLRRLRRRPTGAFARSESAAAGQRLDPVNCATTAWPATVSAPHGAERPLRVPVLGETPTLCSTRLFRSSSYHSLQATLRKQIAHVLTLQATYTFSRAPPTSVSTTT